MNYLLNMLAMCPGTQNAATEAGAEAQQTGNSWYIILIYIVIFAAFIYFIMIRPQKKQKKQQEETMEAMQAGDSVLTTSGFYGTIVAVNGDTVIVEFGNNKNCRIPMAKQAIAQVEKAGAASTTSADAAPVKKFFGKKKEEKPEECQCSECQSSSSDESSEESSSSDAEK